ncbi:uncharacterized protein LOC115546817 [Gadus morhua]|uniref:uncharacterized protein LOC115546817 n=1 Tax=Gadus morhua TaxID=8049 RepID=UPI0011B6D3B0|nr:uncharacterized protein LOC115546817 [Gadus morhua]
MSLFDLESFLAGPSTGQLDRCRKDDLAQIADYFGLFYSRQTLKRDLKAIVVSKLAELALVVLPAQADSAVPEDGTVVKEVGRQKVEVELHGGARADFGIDVEVDDLTKTPYTLPRYDPLSSAGTGSRDVARLKVRLARLQLEAQEKAENRQAQFQLEIKKLEIEADKAVQLRRLELESQKEVHALRASAEAISSSPTPALGKAFDIGKHIVLVPTFRETEVDSYFSAFERIASALQWPTEVWPLLLQCKIHGKAQEAVAALPLEDSLKYDSVKAAILRAYELVPEAYRQKFRNHKRAPTQNYVEFAREKGVLFDKWSTTCKANDFNSLRELILLEEFKKCLPDRIVVYLSEQKVNSLSSAAVLADEYVLTHKVMLPSESVERPRYVPASQHSSPKPQSPRREDRECYYCHKPGHVIANCITRKRRGQQSSSSGAQPKGIGVIKTDPGTKHGVGDRKAVDDCFKPFVFDGLVSLTGDAVDQRPVQILRDTACSQSVILASALPFSDLSGCGYGSVLRGIEMGYSPRPVHRVHIQTKLITGFFPVAVCHALPVEGVAFLMGNDIAGGKVIPALEVLDLPHRTEIDLVQAPSGLFPTCVITRAEARKGYDGSLFDSVLKPVLLEEAGMEIVTGVSAASPCESAAEPVRLLHPIPAIGEPFERVIVDCVGPLPRTKSGNQYLLTIMCAATRYPEAIPLRTITASSVVKALTKFFSTFGLPRVLQTDQGTNFLSNLFNQVLKTLNVHHAVSSAYHPESQGALERWHQTLKSMLRKYCLETEKGWDEGVPFVLFAAREAVQESLGFSPAELVFGHTLRGPLKSLQGAFLSQDSSPEKDVLDYVSRFRERLHQANTLARECLATSQSTMKRRYDRSAVPRHFQVGDKVLALLPIPGSALSARFSGPYEVCNRLSDTDYVIRTPERRRKTRVCHINMLKRYFSRGENNRSSAETPVVVGGCAALIVAEDAAEPADDEVQLMGHPTRQGVRLPNSEMLEALPSRLDHLSTEQQGDVTNLINRFPSLFNDVPTQTNVLQHHIDVNNAKPIKQHPYRVNPVKRGLMKVEAEYLLEHGLAIPSSSPWSSPCLLEAKSDGSPRFITDYRKVNAVTILDSYPLPRMEDCVDNLGTAKYVSKLDLLKGYWQVPLTGRASEISAFVTPDHFLQYTVMAFGMCNAPATFQRLVNSVLAGVANCNAYLDDLIVYTTTWEEHMQILDQVFTRLAKASLTLNLAKCEFGKATVTYLGRQVGQGQVRPVDAKVQAITECPIPSTRRALRRFLGMAGYYRSFCRNFSTITHPLTNLLSPKVDFVWTPECQHAFESAKALLSSTPVLAAPDLTRPFKLEVDASAVGAGAVLMQEDADGVDHPVCYFSRKFNKHQVRYSTIEKETLALLLALQHFEVYVGSSPLPVVIFTDHNPLVFLSRMYNHNQRLMRWALIVQEYNLVICHKKGSENVLADALSRL